MNKTHLVTLYFLLGIVFEMPISFESPLDYLPELVGEIIVEQMVDTETGTRGLGRIRWTDPFLGCANTAACVSGVEEVGVAR
jgi:hypothetical protein